MYAVIATGGKQYRVQPGETIHVERLNNEQGHARESGAITFDEVLLIADGEQIQLGAPTARRRQGLGRDRRRGPGQEDHHLQVQAPQELPPQERPSPAVHRAEDHRHQRVEARRSRWHTRKVRALPQRPRLEPPAPGRQALRRRAGPGRQHPGPPGGHRDPPRQGRRDGPRLHALRAGDGSGGVQRVQGEGTTRRRVSVKPLQPAA